MRRNRSRRQLLMDRLPPAAATLTATDTLSDSSTTGVSATANQSQQPLGAIFASRQTWPSSPHSLAPPEGIHALVRTRSLFLRKENGSV